MANQQTATTPRWKAMRRALQYIDDHLDLPIAVPDIAMAAGLRTRGLYAGCQRDLQMSRMVYLRTARLSAAHDELLEADPASVTAKDEEGPPHMPSDKRRCRRQELLSTRRATEPAVRRVPGD